MTHSDVKPSTVQALATTAQPAAPESAAANTSMPPFHLAFPVSDLDQTKAFYGRWCSAFSGVCTPWLWCRLLTTSSVLVKIHSCCVCSLLGCPEGRSAAGWVDYNLFGHQIVCHHVKGYNASATANAVDGDPVPVPHFGLALSVPQFEDLADRVKKANVQFVIQPHLRFKGMVCVLSVVCCSRHKVFAQVCTFILVSC